jgi:hypothetical protein
VSRTVHWHRRPEACRRPLARVRDGVVELHDERRPIRRAGLATSVAGRRRPHRMLIGAARLRVALEGDLVDAAGSAPMAVSAARFCTHVRVRCKR